MKKLKISLIIINMVFLAMLIPGFTMLNSCKPEKEDDPNDSMVVYKPNIYIYPTEKTQLSLQISFPLSGKILASIPEYGNGWSVMVDTNSMIDGKYNYLFYESTQPDVWQTEKGWLVKKGDLRQFFLTNMGNYGFRFSEIKDFVTFWVPRLTEYEWYEIYPQESATISTVIKFDWSKKPDNILRLFYVIRGTHSNSGITLTEPVITKFKREGFFVAEWGVILK